MAWFCWEAVLLTTVVKTRLDEIREMMEDEAAAIQTRLDVMMREMLPAWFGWVDWMKDTNPQLLPAATVLVVFIFVVGAFVVVKDIVRQLFSIVRLLIRIVRGGNEEEEEVEHGGNEMEEEVEEADHGGNEEEEEIKEAEEGDNEAEEKKEQDAGRAPRAQAAQVVGAEYELEVTKEKILLALACHVENRFRDGGAYYGSLSSGRRRYMPSY